MAYELVWVGPGEGAAAIVAGGLRAKGIRARTSGYNATYRSGVPALQSWAVYVRTRDLERAREHLRDNAPAGIVETPDDLVAANARVLMKPILLGIIFLLLFCIAVSLREL
ncbi:hypothetical protein AYO38_11760 [bacterium SCGC AG-212-C10]|nr:hypothetical protein AYO38_11760 [bacterium SCGC AG-212-C10]